MTHLSIKDFEQMPSRYRAHCINSVTGYKSSNLLGTCSKDGSTNLAIFSSITHLGSNPPLLGFVLRPRTVTRNTYDNLKSTGVFTVNHVHAGMIKQAHQTSAKYPEGVSEFRATGLTEEYQDGFEAPFVKESRIKIGCSYENEYFLKENDCIFIVARIEHLIIDQNFQMNDGFIDLTKAGTITATGLDGYALPSLLDRFSYAEPEKDLNSIL
ncbi:MAG: flavin oxidoreductase [Balneola sp.]|nr:MAG: flavin oxidoreductase [Balneola sp.]